MASYAPLRRPRRGTAPEAGPTRWRAVERLRNWLITGLLVTGPIALTLYLVWLIVDWADRTVAGLFPEPYNPNRLLPFHIPGLGLIAAVLALTAIGALAAGYGGRLVVRLSERIMGRMPLIRGVYAAVKQIFETVLGRQSNAFREVVLIEFPRREMWTIGFLTGPIEGEIQEISRETMLSVLVPTTPNPTSGYLVFVPRRDVVPLSMTVEEGIKLVVSGGIVTPPLRPSPIPIRPPAPAVAEVEPDKAPV